MIHVFLDTQIFVHKNFNFKHELFQRLINDVENKLTSVYLTEVVKKEIETKVYENIKKVKSSQKKFANEARILRSLSEYNNIFEMEARLDSISDSLIGQFNQFLQDVDAKIISVDTVSPTVIFEKYFKAESPFSDRKKDDFPDAFSLIALQDWFEKKGTEVYVVSDDQDLKSFCENKELFIYEPSIESFYNSRNDYYNQQYVDYIVSVYDANYDEIFEQVEKHCGRHGFTLSGEDGDVKRVYINSIELDEDPYIIDIEYEEGLATIAINAVILLSADISYIDYASSPYDIETGIYLFHHYEATEIEDVITVPVSMTIGFKHNDKHGVEFIDTVLNEHESIEIGIKLDDYY